MPDLQTETLAGVELMRVGRWHASNCPPEGCKFTGEDLDAIVATAAATVDELHPPVKLGHNEGQELLQADGLPAAGFVANLRRVGDVLVGDLTNVPKRIADLVRAGAFRTRSVELAANMEVAGRRHPLVLTGLALLGADLPAVEGLADIEALYAGRQLAFSSTADSRFHVAAVDPPPTDAGSWYPVRIEAGETLAAALTRTLAQQQEQDPPMPDDKTFAAEVRKRLGLKDDASDEDVLAAMEAALDAEEEEGEGGSEGEPEPAAAEAIKAENAALKGRVMKLEQENAKAEAERRVGAAIQARKLLPRQKEFALSMALENPDAFDKFVESQPEGLVDIDEKGTSAEPDKVLARLQPDRELIELAAQAGVTVEDLVRQRAMDEGVPLPKGFGEQTDGAGE